MTFIHPPCTSRCHDNVHSNQFTKAHPYASYVHLKFVIHVHPSHYMCPPHNHLSSSTSTQAFALIRSCPPFIHHQFFFFIHPPPMTQGLLRYCFLRSRRSLPTSRSIHPSVLTFIYVLLGQPSTATTPFTHRYSSLFHPWWPFLLLLRRFCRRLRTLARVSVSVGFGCQEWAKSFQSAVLTAGSTLAGVQ